MAYSLVQNVLYRTENEEGGKKRVSVLIWQSGTIRGDRLHKRS